MFEGIKKMFNLDSSIAESKIAGFPKKRKWSDEWPEEMDDYGDVYEQVSVVRQCISLIADFSVSTGYHVKTPHDDLEKRIKNMQKRTNFGEFLKTAVKKREIWGYAAFEIVTDGNGHITGFNALDSRKLKVKVDENTMEIDHFEYLTGGTQYVLDPDDVFYVTKDSLDTSRKGVSALESIKTTIKRKWQLEKDLEQAAMRLWAPYTLFQFDTSYVQDKEKQKREMQKFTEQIKPGKTIVHNKKVEPSIIDMSPDIGSLNESIDNADQEIMGNWSIPKALLSREQSSTGASLAPAVRSLYESTVASVQQYFKSEIENQIYDRIAKEMEYEPNVAEHAWRPPKFHDSTLIRALSYAVRNGVISPKDMVTMLGWDVEDVPDAGADGDAAPRERAPPGNQPETMSMDVVEAIKEDPEMLRQLKEALQ